MANARERIENELNQLSQDGDSLLQELQRDIDYVAFGSKYHSWYTCSLPAIRQLLPDRIEEFERCYHPPGEPEKRVTSIALFLSNVKSEPFILGKIKNVAIGLFAIQVGILKSAICRLDSVLPNIENMLQADFFNSEIDAANELLQNGHLRAAGIIAGVVLESHLKNICKKYEITFGRPKPTLNDFYQELYRANIIDNSQRTLIEYLSSVRNLCAHSSDRDPSDQEVKDLIDGTKRAKIMIL